uniref:Uncharacterized protein n=1 Tax=Arundo donax TaxID=35708 RepID=A0A0A8Y0U6_ARUDO
MDSVLHFFII